MYVSARIVSSGGAARFASHPVGERATRGAYGARSGMTGPAWMRRSDMPVPAPLAETDATMPEMLDVRHDFRYIFSAFPGKKTGDRAGTQR